MHAQRWILLALLIGLVGLFFVETQVEQLGRDSGWLAKDRGMFLTELSHESEGNLSFLSQGLVSDVAAWGFSAAYFLFFPVMIIVVAAAAWKRGGEVFQVFTISTMLNCGIAMMIFAVMPVTERWAHADADAVLLSDRVCVWFIKAFRPVSGINFCFPSTHVSLTCICIAVCFLLWVPLPMDRLAGGHRGSTVHAGLGDSLDH